MKKIKRILAFAGIIILGGLYLATLILAIFDHSHSMTLFRASVYATVIVPVLLWTYSFIYKMIHKKSGDPEEKTTSQKLPDKPKSENEKRGGTE